MTDLFGHTNTAPTVSAPLRKSLINLAHGFPEFWRAWPGGPRKVAKKQCLDKWARYECALSATLIVQHVEWMKTQPDWLKDNGAFIPQPLTYLNQQRWDGWEPVQAPEKPAIDPALAKLTQDAAMAAKPSAEVRAKMAQLLGKARENPNTNPAQGG